MRDRIHIGGAVHRQHVLQRHQEVHDGEDALLDLARIGGTGDQDFLIHVVDQDSRFAVYAVDGGVTVEIRRADDGEVRLAEISQFLLRRTDQQLMDEEVLAGQLVDDTEFLPVVGIRAGEAVEDKQFASLQIGDHLGADGFILLQRDGPVDLAPGDLFVDLRDVHDEFVVRRAAGVLAGLDHQGAGLA